MRSLALTSVGPRRLLAWLACAAAAASLIAAPKASAGDDPRPHDGVSSVSQYVEDIPTADGPVAAGGGSGPSPPPAQLQPAVDEALDRAGGEDAPALKEIATRPALGAPTRALPAGPSVNEVLDDPSAASAVASATTGGGTAVAVVLVLLVLVTLGAAGIAVRRARL